MQTSNTKSEISANPNRRLRRQATATMAIALVSSAIMFSAPASAYTYTTYESRSAVVNKARILKYGTSACKRAVGAIPGWKVLASVACNSGPSGRIYADAAKRNCKMATRVTLNTNSQYSFDKSSNLRHYPYSCTKR